MTNQKEYADFINNSLASKLVLFELGVGFKTLGIICWPFEKIALQHPDATLVRIKLHDSQIPKGSGQKAVCIQHDIAPVIQDIWQLVFR